MGLGNKEQPKKAAEVGGSTPTLSIFTVIELWEQVAGCSKNSRPVTLGVYV